MANQNAGPPPPPLAEGGQPVAPSVAHIVPLGELTAGSLDGSSVGTTGSPGNVHRKSLVAESAAAFPSASGVGSPVSTTAPSFATFLDSSGQGDASSSNAAQLAQRKFNSITDVVRWLKSVPDSKTDPGLMKIHAAAEALQEKEPRKKAGVASVTLRTSQ